MENKKRINPIFTFILGILLATTTVYAYDFMASEVGFTPSGGISAQNVQGAIDEVYNKVVTNKLNNVDVCNDANKRFYSMGDATIFSVENAQGSFNYSETDSTYSWTFNGIISSNSCTDNSFKPKSVGENVEINKNVKIIVANMSGQQIIFIGDAEISGNNITFKNVKQNDVLVTSLMSDNSVSFEVHFTNQN